MRSSTRRGSVFIVTLAALAGLVALVVSVAATQRLSMRAQSNRKAERRARLATQSAIQYALQILAEGSSGSTTNTTGVTSTAPSGATTLQDAWATLGQNGNQYGDVRFVVGNQSFRMQIIDAASRVDINTANQAQLQKLPLTPEQIDSLLDWREGTRTPRPQGGKDEFYNGLAQPYDAALRRLDTLDELLLIKGFSAQDIYDQTTNQFTSTPLPNLADGRAPTLSEIATTSSYSPQTRPSGQAKVNVNTARNAAAIRQAGLSLQDATAIFAFRNTRPGRRFTGLGEVLSTPTLSPAASRNILDNVTTSGATRVEGKINLNTASQTVLESLPNLTPDQAQSIITRQSQGFTRLSDLTSIPGLGTGTALRQVADDFTVSSNSFIVRIIAEAGPAQIATEAIVEVQNSTPKLLRMEEQSFPNMAARWGWPTDPSTENTLAAAQ